MGNPFEVRLHPSLRPRHGFSCTFLDCGYHSPPCLSQRSRKYEITVPSQSEVWGTQRVHLVHIFLKMSQFAIFKAIVLYLASGAAKFLLQIRLDSIYELLRHANIRPVRQDVSVPSSSENMKCAQLTLTRWCSSRTNFSRRQWRRKRKELWRLQTFAASRTVPLVRVITMCALDAPTGSDNSTGEIAKMQIPRSMRTHDLAVMSRRFEHSFLRKIGIIRPGWPTTLHIFTKKVE